MVTNYTYREWLRLCRRAPLKTLLNTLGGPSPGGAAADLGITRQGVAMAVRRETLDLVNVFDKNGRLMFVMVTQDSIEAYRKNQRVRREVDQGNKRLPLAVP